MADVFISYHMESAGEIVKQIAAALENVGVSCWYATSNSNDTGFAAVITKEIRACKVFLLVLNEGSNQSEHVRNELNFAFERKNHKEPIKFISFKADNCNISDDIAFYISRFTIIDGNPPDETHTQTLAEEIADTLNGRPTWAMVYQKTQLVSQWAAYCEQQEAKAQQSAQAQEQEILQLQAELDWAYRQIDALTARFEQRHTQIQSLRELEQEMAQDQAWVQELGTYVQAQREEESKRIQALKAKLDRNKDGVIVLAVLSAILFIFLIFLCITVNLVVKGKLPFSVLVSLFLPPQSSSPK